MNTFDPSAHATLIKTKFSPPRLTRAPVHREQAMQQLAAGLARAFTLVKAPAGFGKTTLLTAWRDTLLAEGRRVAWLTLDQDDNDENRFVEYLGGTLAATLADDAPEFGNLSRLVSVRVQLTSIINLLDQWGEDLTLILDDYDKITAPEVHRLLAFVLQHTPANLHIVAACRTEPPLELACLRARDQLVEIDTDLMRFGFDDTQAFFASIMPARLSTDEARAIHDATEGWVTGLQIATLALPGRSGVRPLVSTLPRHSRALNDYLVENVLHHLPASMVDFMLRSAGPDRLNASLCEHLTGDGDATEKLEWLVRHNLFLQPIDEDGQWYRYHALFADFLRAQLRRRLPDEVKPLDLLAAQWFSHQGRWAEAVRHAIDADRVDLAADWLEHCAQGELRCSRVRNLLGWLEKLPTEALNQRPRLQVYLIWALILTMQTDQAQALNEAVQARLEAEGGPAAPTLLAILRAQRVSITALQDRMPLTKTLARAVWQERFPLGRRPLAGFDWEDEAFLNCMLYHLRKNGDIEEAWRVSEFYQQHVDVTHNTYMLSYRACVMGSMELHDGQTHAAAQRMEEALEVCEQMGGRRSAAATLVAAMLAETYYAWNRLDAVEDLLADRFDVIDDVCYLDPTRSAYLSLARVRKARGAFDAAHALLNKAEALACRRSWPRLQAACAAERVHLHLLEDQPADADRALRKLVSTLAEAQRLQCEDVEFSNLLMRAKARTLLHRGQAAEARDLLQQGLQDKGTGRLRDMPHDLAQLRLLLAIAHHACGDTAAAFARLKEVQDFVEHDGVVRLLADEGQALTPLLKAARAADPSWARSAHAAVLDRMLGVDAAAALQAPAPAPDDNELSRRELDILELITQKLSNKQIAKLLFITPETVKWHLKNIYRKLGVSDRRLAAHKSRQIPLGTGLAATAGVTAVAPRPTEPSR